MEGRVVRISIAPVKALHVVNPDEVELTRAGVVGDRRFWLVDRDGRLVNGKRPSRAHARAAGVGRGARRLALAFPDGSVVEGVVEPGEPFEAELYGQPHPSRRVPGPWQEALSEFAGEPLTLLWSEGGAQSTAARPGRLGVADLARLARAAGRGGRRRGAVDGRRFRMLFEIDGVEPHEEDDVARQRRSRSATR